jgi:hypothetical protein
MEYEPKIKPTVKPTPVPINAPILYGITCVFVIVVQLARLSVNERGENGKPPT